MRREEAKVNRVKAAQGQQTRRGVPQRTSTAQDSLDAPVERRNDLTRW